MIAGNIEPTYIKIMNLRIETIKGKRLVGKRLKMSFTNYKIAELWQSFMPRKKDITNKLTNDLISMVIYQPAHFIDFKLTNEFERWATVEVADFNNIPSDLETFTLDGGRYAVFAYKGLNTNHSIFEYIFQTWLPNSGYVLDHRPHFEVLGEKYKNNDPASEEEIWIPIKPPIL